METEKQVRFLQEIGCSKLQGFYYCKPLPVEEILERYRKGMDVGFEDTEASDYFDTIGRINLYDLDVITNMDKDSLQNSFSSVPIGIIEVRGDIHNRSSEGTVKCTRKRERGETHGILFIFQETENTGGPGLQGHAGDSLQYLHRGAGGRVPG